MILIVSGALLVYWTFSHGGSSSPEAQTPQNSPTSSSATPGSPQGAGLATPA